MVFFWRDWTLGIFPSLGMLLHADLPLGEGTRHRTYYYLCAQLGGWRFLDWSFKAVFCNTNWFFSLSLDRLGNYHNSSLHFGWEDKALK